MCQTLRNQKYGDDPEHCVMNLRSWLERDTVSDNLTDTYGIVTLMSATKALVSAGFIICEAGQQRDQGRPC